MLKDKPNCLLIIFCLLFIKTVGFAQADSTNLDLVKISGFIDVFYAYDFNKPHQIRQHFLYNHNRHNEINLNLGFIKAGLEKDRYRANIAFHAGTYSNDNYAAEPGLLKNIFEANIGIKIGRKSNVWLDAGIMPSHIGFESAVSIDNWTLTRSLLAENSPYYLSGAKLSAAGKNLSASVLVCNGWQRIQRVKGNSLPSFGSQLQYSKNDVFLLNWSTFLGTDDPDSIRRMRFFNNFYGQFNVNNLGVIAGFDVGYQQKHKNSNAYNMWYSPVLILRAKVSDHFFIGLRAEYYDDTKNIIINTGAGKGFQTAGYSINFDYFPFKNIALRLEGRYLKATDDILAGGKSFNYFTTGSIAVKI